MSLPTLCSKPATRHSLLQAHTCGLTMELARLQTVPDLAGLRCEACPHPLASTFALADMHWQLEVPAVSFSWDVSQWNVFLEAVGRFECFCNPPEFPHYRSSLP